ncbi:MAG: uracil phosphoribosyltransferase [Planctomycetota bacterium]
MPETLTLIDHPTCEHHLSVLRNRETGNEQFRAAMQRLGTLLAYASTRQLPTSPTTIQTPVAETTVQQITASIGIVPVLRAGLGLVEPFQNLLPAAAVWHLGMYRDEATATPVPYYDKLPEGQCVDYAFVVDPMLATGGSALLVIERMKQWGVQNITVASVIASRVGIENVRSRHDDVNVVVCAVDEQLNDQSFIVPGLGDAGDRMFGTN